MILNRRRLAALLAMFLAFRAVPVTAGSIALVIEDADGQPVYNQAVGTHKDSVFWKHLASAKTGTSALRDPAGLRIENLAPGPYYLSAVFSTYDRMQNRVHRRHEDYVWVGEGETALTVSWEALPLVPQDGCDGDCYRRFVLENSDAVCGLVESKSKSTFDWLRSDVMAAQQLRDAVADRAQSVYTRAEAEFRSRLADPGKRVFAQALGIEDTQARDNFLFQTIGHGVGCYEHPTYDRRDQCYADQRIFADGIQPFLKTLSWPAESRARADAFIEMLGVCDGLGTAKAIAVRFLERRGGELHVIDGALAFERPFIVEVTFDKEPAESERTARLEFGSADVLEVPLMQNRENPRLYRSRPVTIAPPERQ